jgi:hypothetical protein
MQESKKYFCKLTNQTTVLGMYSVLKCSLIAEWSFENITPYMTSNRMSLDVNGHIAKEENVKKKDTLNILF